MAAEHGAVGHPPPADGVALGEVKVQDPAGGLPDIALIALVGQVGAEPLVVVIVLVFVGIGQDRAAAGIGLVALEVDDAAVAVGHGGIQADLAALGVVDGADLTNRTDKHKARETFRDFLSSSLTHYMISVDKIMVKLIIIMLVNHGHCDDDDDEDKEDGNAVAAAAADDDDDDDDQYHTMFVVPK